MYEGEGDLSLNELIGTSGGSFSEERSEVLKNSPQESVRRFGPFLRFSLDPSPELTKPTLLLTFPFFGPKVRIRISGEIEDQTVANPCYNPHLEKYDRLQWRERAPLTCLGVFGPETLPKTNVVSEGCFNIEKNMELAGQRNLDPALYAQEARALSRASIVRYLNLASAARRYKPRKKKGQGARGSDRALNLQQLQSLAVAVPQPGDSDEWKVPAEFRSEKLHGNFPSHSSSRKVHRKRTRAYRSYVSVWPQNRVDMEDANQTLVTGNQAPSESG